MIDQERKSRRDLLLGGAAVAAGAVAGMATAANAQGAAVKSRQVPQGKVEIEKDALARKAIAELQKIDPSIHLEWVQGSSLVGTRRIIQMKG